MNKILDNPHKYLTLLLILIWMGVIASFSAQHGEASGSLSGTIAGHIVSLEEKILGQTLTEQDRLDRIEFWQFPVRKGAHVSVYLVLGVLLAIHMLFYSITEKKRFVIALLIIVLYACFDELHQYFVPGRVACIKDVGLDTVGGLMGIGLVRIISSTPRCTCARFS